MYCIKKTPLNGAKSVTRVFIISYILLFFSISSFSQNPAVPQCNVTNYINPVSCEFITNGGFSNILDPISGEGEVPDANWWNTHSGSLQCIAPNWGTYADVFSGSLGAPGWTDGINIYSNSVPVIDPTGDGNFAAINVYEDPNNGTTVDLTYIEQELTEPLYPGFCYEVSFKVRRAEVSSWTSDIGVYLTTDYLVGYALHLGDPLNSTVLSHPLATSTQWVTITIPFIIDEQVSPEPLKYITIGQRNGANFQQINNNQFPAGSGEYKGYYFIDDVKLELTCASDESIDLELCSSTGLVNISAIHPNSSGVWTLISGPATLTNPTSDDVDLNFSSAGNYTLQYSYNTSICNTNYTTHTETFNIVILDEAQVLEDTVYVCDLQVDLSQFTNGLEGEWILNGNSGQIVNNIYSGFDSGSSFVGFTPDPGQEPCQILESWVTVIYNPYPKTTTNTFDSDVWNDVVTDNFGNIYTVGTYINKTRIDGNLISSGLSGSSTNEQFMVAKYDSCGVLLWYAWGRGACQSNDNGISTGTSIAYDATYERVYISGQHLGMKFRNSNGNSYDLIGGSSTCYGTETVAYVLELNSLTGDFEDFNGHLTDITEIKSLVIANDGVYNHHLYLGGINENTSGFSNGVICKLDVHQNYSSYINLDQSSPSLKASNAYTNSVNDIFYKDQIIYSVGTTYGYLSFGQKQVSLSLPNGSTSSWVAATYHDNAGYNVLAIGNGGSSPNPGTSRVMTGEQIYVDQYKHIVVSGLYNYGVLNPYNVNYTHFTQGSNQQVKEIYIFSLLKVGSNILLDPSAPTQPFDFISSFGASNAEISSLAMTGYKDNLYISGSYTGLGVLFNVSSNGYTPNTIESKKIFTAHYEIQPALVKTWFNTTKGFDPAEDEHTVKAMCALNNKEYTVGQYLGIMNFQYNNFGPIDEIESNFNASIYLNSGFIYRNDHQAIGMFKSLKQNEKSTTLESDKIKIYPNPNNGDFALDGVDDLSHFEVIDVLGKNISYSSSYSKGKVFIKINNFVGVAIIKINDKNYRVLVQ